MSTGEPVPGPGRQATPANDASPAGRSGSANHRASANWSAPSTVTANTPDPRTRW
jgi:hypothetical protein